MYDVISARAASVAKRVLMNYTCAVSTGIWKWSVKKRCRRLWVRFVCSLKGVNGWKYVETRSTWTSSEQTVVKTAKGGKLTRSNCMHICTHRFLHYSTLMDWFHHYNKIIIIGDSLECPSIHGPIRAFHQRRVNMLLTLWFWLFLIDYSTPAVFLTVVLISSIYDTRTHPIIEIVVFDANLLHATERH